MPTLLDYRQHCLSAFTSSTVDDQALTASQVGSKRISEKTVSHSETAGLPNPDHPTGMDLRSGRVYKSWQFPDFDVQSLYPDDYQQEYEGDEGLVPWDGGPDGEEPEAEETAAGAAEVNQSPLVVLPEVAVENGQEGWGPRGGEKHLEARAESVRRRRRHRRQKERETSEERASTGEPSQRRATLVQIAEPVASGSFLLEKVPHSQQGYVGVCNRGDGFVVLEGDSAERIATLEANGYEEVIPDDRVDNPFLDKRGRVIAVVPSEPEGWEARHQGMERANQRLLNRLKGKRVAPNRRGAFASYRSGFSYGGGQMEPCPFAASKGEKEALKEFFEDEHVRAGFKYADGVALTWFPAHHRAYRDCLSRHHSENSALNPPVPKTCFAASTVNAGPESVSGRHRDQPNLVTGFCLDIVGGKFKGDKGGHLILHELKVFVRLKPGRMILFPSAIITHENIPIQPGETRFSITGYSAGGLWRYADQGMKRRRDWEAEDPDAVEALCSLGGQRWADGCAMFKTVDELWKYWQPKEARFGKKARSEQAQPSS